MAAAASQALQEKINHSGLERFKDFLLNPSLHQSKTVRIFLSKLPVALSLGQQTGFHYQGKRLPCHCLSSLQLIICLLLKPQHSFLISAASFQFRYFFDGVLFFLLL